MNETLNTLKTRRSIRKFKSDPIKDADLNAILEAGMFAPTGGGRQGNLFVVVKDKALREKLAKMNAAVLGKDFDPYYGAPTIILVFADRTKSTPVEDGSLALGNLFNAAHALGLGSCWIHRAREMFETDEGKTLLRQWGVGDQYVGVGACSLGYPDGEIPAAAPRKEGRVIVAQA
ncbi:MAG TPA: diguanylate cyclase [Verrucomicrobia bacterium]|nr:diguanylate cyclase [Verrucomicrobiota bacterium]